MPRSLFLLASAALTALCAPAQAHGRAAPVATAATDPEIVVVGTRGDLLHTPGSGATIEREDLERARILTVNEALRQVAGVFARDEEGLGLRPNIGIRGLSPTRSSKTLLLEDGLPLTYGVYGDNATYSHPPIRRFERIEILKGSGQIRFGPQTVGGVVNYITPSPPSIFEASAFAAGGSNGYAEFDGSVGGEVLGARLLAHANHTQFDGVRANHGLQFDDLYLKAERDFGPDHQLIVRLGRAREDSQISYSGLTEAEYAADPYANPFPDDRFESERFTASATHGWAVGDSVRLTTSFYSIWFDRDWWRQSSNSSQRPNDTACGGMANLSTTCGNEGRLREYNVYGIESRLGWNGALFGAPVKAEAGARWHTERQNRLQFNGVTPNARTPGRGANGGVAEYNLRYAEAVSGWLTAEATFGALRISPGVRVESIDYARVNGLTGQRGASDLTQVIPGVGFAWDVRDDLVAYAGVHRGFAPPRTEDVVTNAGGVVDLDAETSINYEIGLRGDIANGAHFDVTAFVLDFENQIIPASVAGGVGATLTSAGQTRHRGLEGSLSVSLREMGAMEQDDIFFRTAVTWLSDASFEGRRFSTVAGFTSTSVSGNRLSYAPEWIASAAIGYTRGDRFDVQAEVQYTGEMFTDDLNVVATVANGQRGLIPAVAIVNVTANFQPFHDRTALFVTVKNVFDEVYIVDRARGILPGAPRLAQAGISVKF